MTLTIDLSNFSSTDGFVIVGVAEGDQLGFSVSNAGDVNGDGIDDVIIGSVYAAGTKGAAYVVYGKGGDARGALNLSELTESDGFIIQGVEFRSNIGFSVSAAGDINGDGIDDLIVGAPLSDGGGVNAGEAYVIYGIEGKTRGVIDVSNLPVEDGFIIRGDRTFTWVGRSVSDAGDVNGDGIDDIIVGTPASGESGAAYVIYGKVGSARGLIDLAGLQASDGFAIRGAAAATQAGFSVSSAGDVNGDGFDDLIIGAPFGDNGGFNAGDVYVVFGKAGVTRGSIALSTLAVSDGFAIQGDTNRDYAGYSVSSAGDINGDGVDDLIIGARFGDDGGAYAGEAYVIYGRIGAERELLDLTDLGMSDGFIIQGGTENDLAGHRVSAAGDVNGDGIADLIVGAPGNDSGGADAGAAYVIYGKAGVARGVIDLSDLADGEGFAIKGSQAFDVLGWSVSAAGDFNKDGYDDVIVSSIYGDRGGDYSGQSYIVYGFRDVNIIIGSKRSDTLIGTEFGEDIYGLARKDSLFGLAGNDYLFGGKGADILQGGFGDDLLDGDESGDTASFVSALGSISANLTTGLATGDGDDILVEIENLTGSMFDDVLFGDRSGNILDGGEGNDVLYGLSDEDRLIGGAGDDLLIGGKGNDQLQGGEGIDTVSYEAATTGMTVAMQTGAVSGSDGVDSLSGVENLVGSQFGDVLGGDRDPNTLEGIAGNDFLDGLGGDDLLKGGLGNDRLNGGAANDILIGGADDDTILGGDGIDTASYADAIDGVTVDLGTGGASGGAGADTLSGVENVIGSMFDDTLKGDLAANRLEGGQGNDLLDGSGGDDVLSGGLGDDTLTGGEGSDVIDGGDGNDLADYSSSLAAVFVTLSSESISAAAGSDLLLNVENLDGSDFNDTLIGDGGSNGLNGAAGDDIIDGAGGDDILAGGDGNDFLAGGAANDLLTGGAGNDSLIGDDGIDTATYADAASGVTVVIQSGAASGGAGNDFLDGIENLIGSAFDDALNGYTGTNQLEGGLGNDTINGFGGDDVVLGGGGDDTLTGGAGNDQIDGGEGDDAADYYTASGAVTVSLTSKTSSGAAGVDALVSIENLKGSAFGDSLTGDAAANTLDGAAGDDALDGAGGDDRLMAGSGSDTLNGGDGVDTVDYSGATTAVTASLLTGTAERGASTRSLQASDITDPLTQFFNPANGHIYQVVNAPVTWTEAFNAASFSSLSGVSGYLVTVTSATEQAFVTTLARSMVTTGFDNCSIWMGATDVVEEGAWRWISGPEAGLQFWQGLAPSGGGVPTGQFYGPWGTIGPYEPDNATTGGYGPNGLWFSATGEDYLFLNAYYDAGYWSSGYSNPLAVSTPLSPISSADGYRNAYFIEFSGEVSSISETDTLAGIENLTGSSFSDILTGNSAANRLDGGDGNDTLIGDMGQDILLGGLGNDIMDAGRGEDILIGGAGADTLTGGTASDIFRYLDLSDSTAAGRDLITDLLAVDIIDLSAIDADSGSAGNQGFQKVAAFTGAAAQMVLTYNAGANQTLLALDVNGDGVSDFELLMTGSHLDPTGWAL